MSTQSLQNHKPITVTIKRFNLRTKMWSSFEIS